METDETIGKAINETLMSLEWLGFSSEEAVNLYNLALDVHNGEHNEDTYSFTKQEVEYMYFVRWLISQGKISEEM